MQKRKRSLARRLLRIFGRSLLTILVILVIIFFLIQTPFVQNIVRGKAENYLSRKLKTRVRIGGLEVGLFRSLKLKDVYLEDLQRDTLLSVGLIDIRVRMLALLHNHLDIASVHLADVTAKVRRISDSAFNFQFIMDAFAGPPSPRPAKAAGQPMKIDLKELDLDKIRFVYSDTVTHNDVAVWIGHSVAKVGEIDLDRLRFDVPGLEMDKFEGRFVQGGRMVMDTRLGRLVTVGGRLDINKTIFRVAAMQIDSTDFQFDDNRQKRQKEGMDYVHLGVTGLALAASDLAYSPDSISGMIKSAKLNERSGFRLDMLRTAFFYSDHRAQLNDLLLVTPGTVLRRAVTLRYDSPATMIKDAATTRVDLDLTGSRVQVRDILVFAPYLRSQSAFSRPDEVLEITARATGTFDELNIQTLQFSGLQDIRVDLAGRIAHPFQTDRLWADLKVNRISGSRAALVGLLPTGTIPSSITLPDRFNLTGRMTGSLNDVRTDLVLVTSSGTIAARGWVRQFRNGGKASYDLDLRTTALQLGRILQDSLQWGAVTADLKVKGQGLDLHSANAQFNGVVTSATVRQYTYTGMTLEGSIADQRVQLHSTIDDEAVRFDLQASANLANKYPAVTLDWQIDTADLRLLHLVKDTLAFRGHLLADFSNTNPDTLQGRLAVSGISLVQGSQRLDTDSIVLMAANS
ncbi:MAG TPA: AsmA family protein, partial [Puia sp.]|nr:AsmA family protein [Puia sp.]